MTIKHKLTYYIAATILLPVIVGAVGLTILQSRGGQLVSIHDASMLLGLSAGDALIIESVDASTISAGQVIAFADPANSNRMIARRVNAVDGRRGYVTTVSDRNPKHKQPVSLESIVGRAVAVGPKLGVVYDFA